MLYDIMRPEVIPQIIAANPGISIFYETEPNVSTHAPSYVTETSPVLQAWLVDDGWLECQSRFAYWQEGGEKQYTQWESPIGKKEIFHQRVTGLTPGRIYYVQGQARNEVGMGLWDIRQFSTLPAGFLTISWSGGGFVSGGQGRRMYKFQSRLMVIAVPKEGWIFACWKGSAVDEGKVTDPNKEIIEVFLDGDYTLHATFVIRGMVAYVDDDGPNDPGPGDPSVSDPNENGSLDHPFDSIQEAIDAIGTRGPESAVHILPGLYKGHDNSGIDLHGGPISINGAGRDSCIIDCNGQGPAFYLKGGQGSDCIIQGLTITNGHGEKAGAIYLANSRPLIRDCRISNCTTSQQGGAVFCDQGGRPVFEDCILADNGPNAIWLDGMGGDCGLEVRGRVIVTKGGIGGRPAGLASVTLGPDSILEVVDSSIDAAIMGSGVLLVPAGHGLTIAGNSLVRLSCLDQATGSGLVRSEGSLYLTDNAVIEQTQIALSSEALVDGQAMLSGNYISVSQRAVCGLSLGGKAKFVGNTIDACNDRYLQIRPGFVGQLAGNRVVITIDKGTILEVKGRDDYVQQASDNMVHLAEVPNLSPTSWSIDQLVVTDGQRLRLADRINDQGTDPRLPEVMYVRSLVLGSGGVLDLGRCRLYYKQLDQAKGAQIVDQPLLGFCLDTMDFEDQIEYYQRVKTNNTDDPIYPRLHVQRIADPNITAGYVLLLQNLQDLDPLSQNYGLTINARAKVRFAASVEDELLVRFRYWAIGVDTGYRLAVYLSDSPVLITEGSSDYALHYKHVGWIDLPGSTAGWCLYEKEVSTLGLDLSSGTWIELALVGSASAGRSGLVAIDDMMLEVLDCGPACLDLNWDGQVDVQDFLQVIAAYGQTAGLTEDMVGSTACLDGILTQDGFIDCYDVFSWDWALNNRSLVANTCQVLVVDNGPRSQALGSQSDLAEISPLQRLSYQEALIGQIGLPGYLMILGKGGSGSGLLEDRLCVFTEQGYYGLTMPMADDRCFHRLIRDGTSLYLLNSQSGIGRLRESGLVEPVVPCAVIEYPNEPRWGSQAKVAVGIQTGDLGPWGRPIWDAAFIGEFGYIAPVIVIPDGKLAYTAVAKVQLKTNQMPPYDLMEVYDMASTQAGQIADANIGGIRELEADESGTLYALDIRSDHKRDALVVRRPDGRLERVLLDWLGIEDPVGLCLSSPDRLVYLASARCRSYPIQRN
ncbi:MAG: right-handed parallel beta-helix repeat-containing protein [Sedimentisphaerales bacterium]|nr:right-handed parallel beta-helix repeat-containing protein [Sedimentisphaerales bacterium]